MTPKEKAQELFDKIYKISGLTKESKEISLIAIYEILKITSVKESWFNIKGKYQERYIIDPYWDKVKQEIEKL